MTKKCVKCGKILEKGQFCTNCGAELQEFNETNRCPICNEELLKDEKFCHNCGNPVQKKDNNKKNNSDTAKWLVRIIIIIIAFFSICIIFSVVDDNKKIDEVKSIVDKSFIDRVPLGTLTDELYKDGDWSVKDDENDSNKSYITFKGTSIADGKKIKIVVIRNDRSNDPIVKELNNILSEYIDEDELNNEYIEYNIWSVDMENKDVAYGDEARNILGSLYDQYHKTKKKSVKH